MGERPYLSWVYLLNASVLITHEIDSAYWNEWELFGFPGGPQLFLVLNLVVVAVFLYGLSAVIRGKRSGLVFSFVLAGGGLVAAALHSYFLAAGDRAFRLPVSIALLVGGFVLSVLQVVVTIREQRRS